MSLLSCPGAPLPHLMKTENALDQLEFQFGQKELFGGYSMKEGPLVPKQVEGPPCVQLEGFSSMKLEIKEDHGVDVKGYRESR